LEAQIIVNNYIILDSRAFNRDVETQFYIYSFCEKFSEKLHHEAEDNFSDCNKISYKDILKDKVVKLKFRHKLMAKYLKKYL
jgi:hypothetical protein